MGNVVSLFYLLSLTRIVSPVHATSCAFLTEFVTKFLEMIFSRSNVPLRGVRGQSGSNVFLSIPGRDGKINTKVGIASYDFKYFQGNVTEIDVDHF